MELDRRFLPWSDGKDADADIWARYRLSDGTFGWAELLQRRRVVVLAEGGSGKSTEFRRQTEQLTAAGQDAWYLSVQQVADNGVENSLRPSDRARYRSWLTSDRPGWLFVDSVDEAKLNHIGFERCLRQLGAGIAGAEARAHIVISARHSDWEFRRDLQRLNEELPLPTGRASPSPPTPDELLVSILHYEQPPESAESAESALIVVMVPLDVPRVRRFAEGRGVSDLDRLLDAIEQADLWDFVRRPLDLGWLLDYWRREGRLGSLAETIKTSLTERLKESDPERARRATLDGARAMNALERIGAAMVFGRIDKIAIPDKELDLASSEPALKLEDVLPDYSGIERRELINRPVFDPATFGRTRLHNDNHGVVRSYLAARWLVRLRNANLAVRDLFGLLFGESYGIKVIKPSMRETAAWLALWDRDVAHEVAQREPWVLLTGGDPGSLAAETRRDVLLELAHRMVQDAFLLPSLDNDSLRRFSKRDLSTTVRELWYAHPEHPELRWLLLRIVSFGEIKECADLACEVAFEYQNDHRFRILAARALGATADESTKARYAQFVLSHLKELPNAVIWDAVDQFFPVHIAVDDLLRITAETDITDSDHAVGFEWEGSKLAERLRSASDIEQLLGGLLRQLGGRPGSIRDHDDKREDAFFPAIATLACQLLRHSHQDAAPALAIEAALRLGQDHQRSTMSAWKHVKELPDLLLSAPPRRRLVFWEAATRLADHPALCGRSLEEPYQMRLLGWSPRLCADDLDWLLIDGPRRPSSSQRRLAINAALELCHTAGNPPEILERIRAVAAAEPAMHEAFEAATTPRSRTAEEEALQAEINELRRRNAEQRAEQDRGWSDFIAHLRKNPEQLRDLRPVTEAGADARLVNLWKLLSEANHGKNRYAVETVASLEPLLGTRLAEELRNALIGFWRSWHPRLASTRDPAERNQVRTLDCMGITGVTLEAQRDALWATRLEPALAERAAAYATLELNGFPQWLAQLAAAHPHEVATVLSRQIHAEIAEDPSATHYKILESLSYADDALQNLLAPALVEELNQRSSIPEGALAYLLEVVGGHIAGHQRAEFLSLALARFRGTDSLPVAALYIGAAFAVDAAAAADALTARLDDLSEAAQTELVERLLPLLFGDRFLRSGANAAALTFPCLIRLIRIAYATVRVADDRHHPSGIAYSPDQRDHAEWARSAAFKRLVETPGRATYEALLQLGEIAGFPISREHLTSLAIARAAEDSEHAPWLPADAKIFEESSEALPRIPLDLQRLALSRLADIQDDLLNSDFAQGRTLKALADERTVQRWIADRLELMGGRSYSVERESHVADEKEPDIRLRAKQSQATLSIEIKVAESWTLEQLEEALVTQLCRKYLRARGARHGILLVVHQRSRERGWEDAGSGTYLNFAQVIDRLKERAHQISGMGPDSPQPEVAVLDVSGVKP